MGIACAIERRIKSTAHHPFYNLKLTGIPSYDKVYHECQKYVDRFAELKLAYEAARSELIAAIGAEIITLEVYGDAMDVLILKLLESNSLEKNSIQFIERHPYLLVDGQSKLHLVKGLQPVIKFIMILQKTQQEMAALETMILMEKRITEILHYSYKENTLKAGLEDFDRILGKEIAKRNAYLMAGMLVEIKAYQQELKSVSASLPKFLSKAKERIMKKFASSESDMTQVLEVN